MVQNKTKKENVEKNLACPPPLFKKRETIIEICDCLLFRRHGKRSFIF